MRLAPPEFLSTPASASAQATPPRPACRATSARPGSMALRVSRLEVSVGRHAQVVGLLRPRRLPAHELCECSGFALCANWRASSHRQRSEYMAMARSTRLAWLKSLPPLELSHVREHGGDEHLVTVRLKGSGWGRGWGWGWGWSWDSA